MKKSIKLFEIIVYPENEEKYYKKWEYKKNEFINHQIETGGVSYDEAFESFKRSYRDVYFWNYNKICGFISVFYNPRTNDVEYEIYKQERNYYNKKVTLRLERIYGPNLHDYIGNKSNNEIVQIIDYKIKYIKEIFFSNNYIDLTCYDNLKFSLDFNSIMKKGSDLKCLQKNN